ncbi:hypothetical protein ACCS67_15820 [Rhizobium brockwellii]|uniref:hypothetical protein n=1 Tax=Rhizobium brockwellii TaxID=3019932 RepID=UPI003F98BFF6
MPSIARLIWRDYITDGIPSSGNNKPSKSEIRSWGTWVESILNAIGVNAGLIYQTRALLYADLAKAANSMAWVTSDPTVAYNGVYQKVGGTGTGSWTRLTDLPYSFIRAEDAGAGTPDAIQATSGIPISNSALIILNIFEDNISSPVTVAFNGDTPLTIKTNSGNDILAGGLTAGMQALGIVSGATFRLVTDIDVSAAVAAAEDAAADAETAKTAAELAASSLLFRIFASVVTATAATIPSSSAYIAIAEFSPQPRFYRRFVSDPGTGDRFQSADGAWWQGLPLPGTALDFAHAVARSANATLVAGDLDQVHIWTIGTGTTYTATLPDPDTYIGRLLHLEVDDASLGLLAIACVDPVGKFVTGDLVLWAGESLTLIARAGKWEIIGGRCIPAVMQANNPGADLAATWVASSGWVLLNTPQSFYPGAPFCINAGALRAPRKGFYDISFHAGVSWATAPTFAYGMAHNTGNSAQRTFIEGTFSNLNNVINSEMKLPFAKDANFLPVVQWSGGSGVVVAKTSIGAPVFSLKESPQW